MQGYGKTTNGNKKYKFREHSVFDCCQMFRWKQTQQNVCQQHQCREHGALAFQFSDLFTYHIHLQQGKLECSVTAMLTTFKDPMGKCSLRECDIPCCQIHTLDELSAWQFKCSQLRFELCDRQSNQPWIGECGGAAFCCPSVSFLAKLHLTWPWGVMLWESPDPLVQMSDSTKKASRCKLT